MADVDLDVLEQAVRWPGTVGWAGGGRMMFNGKQVFLSAYASRVVSTVVRRSWRERLFSRPWRPWRATKVVSHTEPCMFDTPLSIVMHPVLWNQIKKAGNS